jgi:hypothetical protein
MMQIRVFLYEVVNFVNAGTFKQWSSTVWSWVSESTTTGHTAKDTSPPLRIVALED